MRRRITVAILGVVVGTLLLTVAGGLFFVKKAATSTARTELVGQAQSLGQLLSTRAATADQVLLRVLRKVGSYEFLAPTGITPSGSFEALPAPLISTDLDTTLLLQGQTISGTVGNLVFVATPVTLSARERSLQQIPPADVPVLLVTKEVANPVNGFAYFALVAAAVLLIGVGVAAFLARRISAPLVRAVRATRRITSGDLTARVPVEKGDDPELAELGEAINSLGESLARSRGLERQFLMSVSHELRTPLTSIRGYADAVAEGATDDVGGAANVITSEARRLERLVQDLLDLARLDARQFSLHLERMDASLVAEGVAEGFKPEAASIGIALDTSVPHGVEIWVDADPDRLAQIVANLVENAFKFAASRVEVGAGSTGKSQVVWVTDDGPGISSEDLPHVFDRHFRSDRARARRVGTGLGLAIVSELAGAMGAAVNVESPLPDGRGTRMSVWFPAKSSRTPEPPTSPMSAGPRSSGPRSTPPPPPTLPPKPAPPVDGGVGRPQSDALIEGTQEASGSSTTSTTSGSGLSPHGPRESASPLPADQRISRRDGTATSRWT